MANATLSTIAAVLEELYIPADAQEHILRANPTLALIPHVTTGGGKYRHVPVKYVRPQGRSNTFSDALANGAPTGRVAFDVPWKSNYQVGGIDGDVIDDAKGNKVMLVDHIDGEINGAMDNLSDDIGFNLFRNFGGARGKVGAVSAGVITLDDIETVAHFEVGMQLVCDTADGTTSGTARSGVGTVTDVDRDLGKVTYSGTITSIATNDFIFAEGDKGEKMAGFESWVPYTAPTATAFYGVDRTSDLTRLSGVRYDATSDTTRQALSRLATRIRRFKKGSMPDLAVVSPIVYGELDIALESEKRVTDLEGPNGAVGFEAIRLFTPAGSVNVIEDPNCPADRLRLINTKSWCFETCGEMVRLLDDDGSMMLRQAAADGYEFRLKSRGNIYCKEPGSNGVAAL